MSLIAMHGKFHGQGTLHSQHDTRQGELSNHNRAPHHDEGQHAPVDFDEAVVV